MRYAKKRASRPMGRSRPRKSPYQQIEALAEWDALHEVAEAVPLWQPGDLGRPPLFPPVVLLLYEITRWVVGSEAEADACFRDPHLWEPIRRTMAKRYPLYKGLRRGQPSPNRHHWRHGSFGSLRDALDELLTRFRDTSAALATRVGLIDPALGSLSHPAPENVVFGDGTVIPARYKARPGTFQVDPETGELTERRYDPDANWYARKNYTDSEETADDDARGNDHGSDVVDPEESATTVRGTLFGFVGARIPSDRDDAHEFEQVILDVFECNDGREAEAGLRSISEVCSRLPDVQGVAWDKAMRGTHIDEIYRVGLVPVVKVAKAKGGKPRNARIQTATARRSDTTTVDVEIWAINGAASILAIAQGEEIPVMLTRGQTRKRVKNDRTRWYQEYRIPDDPLVARNLRGAELMIRLDTTAGDRGKLNRADVLRQITQGDGDWDRLHGVRNAAESVNSWIKSKLPNKRGPAVGRDRQHLALVCGALYHNFLAEQAAYASRAGPLATAA